MVLGALRGRGLPLLWWIAAVLVPGETAATDSPGVFVGFWKTVPRKTKGSYSLLGRALRGRQRR